MLLLVVKIAIGFLVAAVQKLSMAGQAFRKFLSLSLFDQVLVERSAAEIITEGEASCFQKNLKEKCCKRQ